MSEGTQKPDERPDEGEPADVVAMSAAEPPEPEELAAKKPKPDVRGPIEPYP